MNITPKKYLAPEMKVVEIESADIICTSDTTDSFSIPPGTGYEETPW